MATSSVKIFVGDDTTNGRSIKSKGLNIEPCGTLEKMETSQKQTTTHCCLVVRKTTSAWIHQHHMLLVSITDAGTSLTMANIRKQIYIIIVLQN